MQKELILLIIYAIMYVTPIGHQDVLDDKQINIIMSVKTGETISIYKPTELLKTLYDMINSTGYFVINDTSLVPINRETSNIRSSSFNGDRVVASTREELFWTANKGLNGNTDNAYTETFSSSTIVLPSVILDSLDEVYPNSTTITSTSLKKQIDDYITKVGGEDKLTKTDCYNLLIKATAYFSKIIVLHIREYFLSDYSIIQPMVATLMGYATQRAVVKNNVEAVKPPVFRRGMDYNKFYYKYDAININIENKETEIKEKFPLSTINNNDLFYLLYNLYKHWYNNNRYSMDIWACHYVCHTNWGSGRSRR